MESLETKYGHLFVDGEDQYLFVRVLGIGMEASAQLVVHVQTGELVVRKVDKRLLDTREKEKQDPERILFLVQSQARLRGVQPNTAHLLSADDVPAPQRRGGKKLLHHRVKYFKFYNGGNLGDLRDACQIRSLAPPPSMIRKMIQQVVHALNFMYTMKPYIIHGDAHIDNIFLHWGQNVSEGPEFFLGDFGWSTCGTIRAGNRYGLSVDIFQLWMHTRELLDIGAKASSSQSALRQYLEAVIEPELRRLAHGPASLLPNLAPLLKLLAAAPAATPPDMRPFMLTRESHTSPSPLLYDTWEEAQKARSIHGPWHVAQLSPSTYHRPTPASPDDADSGSDEEWVDITSPPEDWTLIEHKAAQGDACNCADRPRAPSPVEEPEDVDVSVRREPLGFFSLPIEIRNEIYALWLADLNVLTGISAVRTRMTEDILPTRLSRNYPTDPPQRHIMWEPPEGAPAWRPEDLAPWEREVAAITYEPAAPDDALQSLPVERLALLRVSRAMNQEAGGLFYRQRFSFTNPREIIRDDNGTYFGILALEAFLTDRTDATRDRLSDIEIDLRMLQHPDLRDDRLDYAGREVTMREYGQSPRLNWTNGLDRLPFLADRLREMPFWHLHLHFDGVAPLWYEFRITDPRQVENRFGNPTFPWTIGLFNIGPRNRLHLTLAFDHALTLGESLPRRRAFIHNAVWMLMVIRHFLLRNARALELGYEGIRVNTEWEAPEINPARSGFARVVANRGVLVECDDEYIPESNEIRSRLLPYNYAEAGPVAASDQARERLQLRKRKRKRQRRGNGVDGVDLRKTSRHDRR
ncbi:hypothetical protein INS49_007277 [Diaporthe citri]|uniref:uncharacterized protein n=1 Tax=Diaporthe citri TaxID=83186 RepID=UPI001C80E78D|nr:uncharacterized protein INS49_007277 [Diaporthe citri]KAG6365666.1 hypothetical protein INS49_007277 [Diaporthe citri]